MANRLEWQQISAQGLNPQSAMGLSIEGFRGAASRMASRPGNREDPPGTLQTPRGPLQISPNHRICRRIA